MLLPLAKCPHNWWLSIFQAASWNAYAGHTAHPYSSLAADTRHAAGEMMIKNKIYFLSWLLFSGAGAEGFHPADYSRLSQYPPEGLYTHPPHGRRADKWQGLRETSIFANIKEILLCRSLVSHLTFLFIYLVSCFLAKLYHYNFARPSITILLMILLPPWQSKFCPRLCIKEGRCCRPCTLPPDIYWQHPAFLTFFKLLRQRWYLG